MKPTLLDAYQLLHEGTLALADVERNGICIDTEYLDNAIRQADEQAARLKAKLEQDDIWKLWKKTFRDKANLGSKTQLATIIFDKLGHKPKGRTATGKHKSDEAAYADIKLPFVKRYFRREKIRKAKGTYLEGIRDETVGGLLHAFFNLHTVVTFRGSSDRPNMQNQPARNEDMAELVRRCFIPREGHMFIEMDYAAIEVRIIACYSKDSALISYINDPTTDMHRDIAAQLFMLEAGQVDKKTRYCNPPEAPIWMGDLSFKPIGDVKVGDVVMGWTRQEYSTNAKRIYKHTKHTKQRRTRKELAKSIVTAVHKHKAKIYKITMESGRTIRCTKDHLWLDGKHHWLNGKEYFKQATVGCYLAHLVEPVGECPKELLYDAGYLGGMMDGEGTAKNMIISQSWEVNAAVCRKMEDAARRLGFKYRWRHESKEGRSSFLELLGTGDRQHGKAKQHRAINAEVKFLNWCHPAKRAKLKKQIMSRSSFFKSDRIVSIEPDGEGTVIGLTTTTGNYVAWGYASKNCGKNQFVFPEFYGSYYVDCARNLWDHTERMKLEVDGQSMYKWLASKGIKKLGACDPQQRPEKGTFEKHVQNVEEDFKHRRFKEHTRWREDWWAQYTRKGYLDTLTGFRLSEVYRRNQVVNSPIQGCLAGKSRVLTKENGWVPIQELVGKTCQVWTGFKWADAVGLDRGKCRRAVVRLKSGLVIHCDTRHKLKNDHDEWVQFKNLKAGDLIALPKVPDTIQPSADMNWWFMFGFLIGDGHFSTKREDVTITGGLNKKHILRSIYHFLLSQGYRKHGYRSVKWKVIPPDERRKKRYRVSLADVQFASFLKEHGFDFRWGAKTKRVPEAVWRATKQQQRDFMEGLWLSDGSRLDKSLHMTSKKLLRDVQILTGMLGFDSMLYNRPTETCDQTASLCFTERKMGSNTPRRYPMTAMSRFVKDVRKKNYADDEYVTYHSDHNIWRNGKRTGVFNQNMAERIINHNSQVRNPAVYRYDEIVAIKLLDKDEITYTMSVDDPLHQFVADGVVHKNSAFHCLLWSLIQLNKWLKKYKMRSCIVNQVHDSFLIDVHPDERDDILHQAVHISTVAIRKHWPWIVVPLEIEIEECPVGSSWFDKHKIEWKGTP